MQQQLCSTLAVCCIDFRLQQFLDQWLATEVGYGNFDRVQIAGGIKDLGFVIGQVTIAVHAHQIRQVIFINHENCAVYGASDCEDAHFKDLRLARQRILEEFPSLQVTMVYMKLSGEFIAVNE
ncbi:hypothetical protein HGA91_00040 [candidate division WWE3 bacterium]|nr:hypothetical protein [candidate division WWE3 bacterium]